MAEERLVRTWNYGQSLEEERDQILIDARPNEEQPIDPEFAGGILQLVLSPALSEEYARIDRSEGIEDREKSSVYDDVTNDLGTAMCDFADLLTVIAVARIKNPFLCELAATVLTSGIASLRGQVFDLLDKGIEISSRERILIAENNRLKKLLEG